MLIRQDVLWDDPEAVREAQCRQQGKGRPTVA